MSLTLLLWAFQSTRPVRGGTTSQHIYIVVCVISIHPPRAGRDVGFPSSGRAADISIHPPRAGRDFGAYTPVTDAADFNPPAPCGAGQLCRSLPCHTGEFQSTRPVRGGTFHMGYNVFCDLVFQSTRPVRGGTSQRLEHRRSRAISIHPPRAGRDGEFAVCKAHLAFQSTRPVRGGTSFAGYTAQTDKFQSTRPMRGGTRLRQ